MKSVFSFLCVLFFSVVLFSCSKNDSDTNGTPGGGTGTGTGGGTSNCDTMNMKYAANIQPFLQASCYSCHGNGQVNGGVTLDSYNGVKAAVDNSRLLGAITHATGFAPMPQGGPKLSDCNINKIRGWINRGAQNN